MSEYGTYQVGRVYGTGVRCTFLIIYALGAEGPGFDSLLLVFVILFLYVVFSSLFPPVNTCWYVSVRTYVAG